MKSKIIKTISAFLFLLTLVFTVMNTIVQADSSYESKMSSLIDDQKDWDDSSSATEKTENVIVTLIAIFRIVGICVAVTLLLVISMKYMSAAPGEKADIKKSAVAYVVGATVLFGAVGILGIISDFAVTNIKVGD